MRKKAKLSTLCCLQAEAKYYCIEELSSDIESVLVQLGEGEEPHPPPICRVPLITSQREEQALINANNMKPVVKV
jgi:BTB/POZ domain-containing adapter for CUL3-mediated RhoA degradation protein